jgi:hypothetical protein
MVDTITHAIQLAVTPVFLLAGVGAILSVMANRLARIVDRARALHGRIVEGDTRDGPQLAREIEILRRRILVVNLGITLCTLCALLICAVVAVIFLGSVVVHDMGTVIAGCFVSAMGSLVGALLSFLYEIYLATVRMPIMR